MTKKYTLIFLHGAGVAHQWWHPQINELSGDFQTIAPDMPGHGKSADKPFDISASLKVIEEITDELPHSVILVGISMGGYLAIQFAHQHPKKVAGLILSGCSMNLNGMAGFSFKLTGLFLRMRGPKWLEEVTLASYRKRLPDSILSPVLEAGFFAKSAVSAFSKLSGKDYHKMLKAFNGPTLVLNGEKDEPNRDSDNKLAALGNYIQIRVIENAGHLCNLEQPQEFSEAISEFIHSMKDESVP